ncbi:MAG TPA: hypothetical protein VIH90_01415 [Candidatus Saccharimonadales bacterium]
MLRDDGLNEQSKTPCPPEIRAIISHMDDLMSSDRRYNHAGVPTQIAVDLIKEERATSLSEFEGWLREMDSRAHFVGVPLDFFGEAWSDKTVNPFATTDIAEYTLWVGVNGDIEASELMERIGISPEENSIRLLTTGILSVT